MIDKSKLLKYIDNLFECETNFHTKIVLLQLKIEILTLIFEVIEPDKKEKNQETLSQFKESVLNELILEAKKLIK